ncbi:MAG TPA: YceH family protein [Tepidisphaeraceae bacterium]|jgi:hypothetical protein
MIQLHPNEARALGVLIEKAATTPEQYPLSLNALTAGCNQKNNRDPVLNLSEDDVFTAVESLREKQLTVRVDAAGSRVSKYRHEADRIFKCSPAELAVLAELLIRGPQTLGELRGRASRMQPLNTLDDVKNLLTSLSQRDEPLIKQIAPSPGSRAERYAQLLTPIAETTTAQPTPATPISQAPASPSTAESTSDLLTRLSTLEQEVHHLRTALQKLAANIGEPDPLA